MSPKPRVATEALAPVLRVSNTEASIPWYERLGFALEFEHSSGPALGETMAILKRGELALILSDRESIERADGIVYLRVVNVAPIAAEFDVPMQNSAIGAQIELQDPDGNRIRVVEDPLTRFPRRRGHFIGPR